MTCSLSETRQAVLGYCALWAGCSKLILVHAHLNYAGMIAPWNVCCHAFQASPPFFLIFQWAKPLQRKSTYPIFLLNWIKSRSKHNKVELEDLPKCLQSAHDHAQSWGSSSQLASLQHAQRTWANIFFYWETVAVWNCLLKTPSSHLPFLRLPPW